MPNAVTYSSSTSHSLVLLDSAQSWQEGLSSVEETKIIMPSLLRFSVIHWWEYCTVGVMDRASRASYLAYDMKRIGTECATIVKARSWFSDDIVVGCRARFILDNLFCAEKLLDYSHSDAQLARWGLVTGFSAPHGGTESSTFGAAKPIVITLSQATGNLLLGSLNRRQKYLVCHSASAYSFFPHCS